MDLSVKYYLADSILGKIYGKYHPISWILKISATEWNEAKMKLQLLVIAMCLLLIKVFLVIMHFRKGRMANLANHAVAQAVLAPHLPTRTQRSASFIVKLPSP